MLLPSFSQLATPLKGNTVYMIFFWILFYDDTNGYFLIGQGFGAQTLQIKRVPFHSRPRQPKWIQRLWGSKRWKKKMSSFNLDLECDKPSAED